MEPKYELIQYIPGTQFVLHKMNKIQTRPHWHRDLELVYVAEGQILVDIDERETKVSKHQLAVINAEQMHTINNDPSIANTDVLVLQIGENLIRSLGQSPSVLYLETLIDLRGANESAKEVRQCFAEMLEEVNSKGEDSQRRINMVCHRLLSILIRHHQLTDPPERKLLGSRSQQHMRHVFDYIEDNYSRDISQNDVAEHEGINAAYLSRLFTTHTNTTFAKYLNALRVEKVRRDLIETSDSITDIYLRHGFNSAKTFNRVFRDLMGVSPREYRSSTRPNSDQNYLSDYYTETAVGTYVSYHDGVPSSAAQTDEAGFFAKASAAKPDLNVNGQIRACYGQVQSHWRAYYRKVVATGRAHDVLLANWREHFEICQREIGFEHIRFHGLLNEEIGIVKSRGGQIYYNFHYVDVVFDYLLSCGIKPYIELSFMPDALKSGEGTLFHYSANITMPCDMRKWSELVAALVKHLVLRYSLPEVRMWHFEVWNEPDLRDFFAGTFGDYLRLYEATYQTIKGVDAQLLVGGPSASSMVFSEKDKLMQFLAFLKKKDMRPDFVSMHPYPVSLEYSGMHEKIIERMHRVEYTQKGLDWARNTLDLAGFSGVPIHMNEWNSSPRLDDYLHDTAFMATYVIDTVIRCANRVDVLAWWTLSDILDEAGTVFQEFGGGFGLINRSGLKKPQFFGFWALSRLSEQVLCQGEDYIVTQSDDGVQALFWNHCFYNERYASGDKALLTYYERYSVFEEAEPKGFCVFINGLPGCTCLVKRSCFDRCHGSIFDFWLEHGAIEYMKPDQLHLMQENNHLHTELYFEQHVSELTLEVSVEPHGFVLYEICFQ